MFAHPVAACLEAARVIGPAGPAEDPGGSS